MRISKKSFGILFIFIIVLIVNLYYIFYSKTSAYEEQDEKNVTELLIQNTDLHEEEEEILKLINNYRKENGLEELTLLASLQNVASLKGNDLVQNNYFSHESPTLGTPFEMLKANGINYTYAGENLAGDISSTNAFNAWINSPSHNENILNSHYRYTGIAAVNSPIYGRIYVQLFI